MKRLAPLALALTGLAWATPAAGLVHYDRGQRTIDGVQLLQDADDPLVYYYLPQAPRLATYDDGSYQLLCIKYVGADDRASGGLFHALIELTLPEALLAGVRSQLAEEVEGARIAGAVPLLQAVDDGADAVGSFEVVSALLQEDEGEEGRPPFTRTVITSGRAPLSPGSRAVVAALLEPEGATLLFDSLRGPTSDVSVSVRAYYEALVEAYGARVVAEVETVYEHFSRVQNLQSGFTKRDVRRIVDELQRDGVLEIEVRDRTEALGVDAADLEGILQVVTDKLTELMFDATAGWAKDPTREAGVEEGQIRGRQEPGFLHQLFSSGDDSPYYTDNQYVLKRREDVTRNTFVVDLTRRSTIKVPFDTAGNLGGLYDELADDPRYFRVVDLADPSFEKRSVHFQVDGEFLDAFQDTVNFVSVSFRKRYAGERPDFTRTITFTHQDVAAGSTVREISFPRLGQTDAAWTEYEYQVRWSLRDGPVVAVPAEPARWQRGHDAAVSLTPPFTRHEIEIEADRRLFDEREVATGVVEFAVVLGDEPQFQRQTTLRADDADPVRRVALYHDRDEPVAYRVSWYSPDGAERGELKVLESDFLYLVPPAGETEPEP